MHLFGDAPSFRGSGLLSGAFFLYPDATMRYLRCLTDVRFHMAAFLPAAILLFYRQLHTGPMFDDFVYFLWFDSTPWKQLPYLLDPGNGYIWARPLATFFFYLEYRLTHEVMTGFRIAGMLWHGLIAATVTVFAGRVLRLSKGPAILAGWLFLLHPAAVQSVCYPSARGEQVFLFFFLWSLVFVSDYLTRLPGASPATETRGHTPTGSGRLILAVTAFILALAAKETAVALPAVLAVYAGVYRHELLLTRRIVRRRGLSLWLLICGVTGAYLVYRLTVMQGVGGYGWLTRSGQTPVMLILSTVRWIIWDLPVMHFFPWAPGPDGIPGVLKAGLTGLWMIVIVLAGQCIKRNRHRSAVVFSGAFLLIAQLMIAAVFAGSDPDILAPRYVYMGSVAAACILAVVLTTQFRESGIQSAGRRILIILLVPVWLAAQVGFQVDFLQAGRASDAIIDMIRPHCYHLLTGGEIDIYNVPDRMGSISINIPSDRLAIFNLEGHRQCGLAVRFKMADGQSAAHWRKYMNDLPGRIGVFRGPPPKTPPAGVIVLDFRNADLDDAVTDNSLKQ